jgi:hypothetical protein
MADEHDDQRSSFHWPPTAEELESIQVVEMSDGTPYKSRRAKRAWWRKPFGESTLAQAGTLAASLAAIGIALTSLLAPAQPVVRAAKNEARAPLAAQPVAGATPTAVATTSAPAPVPFRPMVTLDVEKPSPSEIHAPQPRTATAAAAAATAAAVEPRETSARPVSMRAPAHAERRVARRTDAGRDPVSKFAVHTGVSVWKAMRAVGRSLKRDGDQSYWASRSTVRAGGGRRTASAADLRGDSAPSDR